MVYTCPSVAKARRSKAQQIWKTVLCILKSRDIRYKIEPIKKFKKRV